MIAYLLRAALIFAAFGLASAVTSQPPLPPPDEPPSKQDEPQPGVKVADKGPIHEAFAQPGAEVRGKEMTAPKAPPAPITEVPPDTKPEGANVKWIPGYWQWDAGKNDFIWISGFYRNVPPTREWQPGKWIEKDGKNIYTPGFWRPTDKAIPQVDLPEPPKTIENGPSTPTDNPDAMWVPGGWEYRNSQFVWRSGYWAAPYKQLMWQPGQYVYGGSGYTYVPGYWDYPLEQRGLLYAPVYIDPQVILNPNWTYTPQYGIGVGGGNGWGNGGLFGSMFVGPNYNNYYYGNGNAGNSYADPYGLGGFGFGLGYGAPLLGYGGFYPWWFTGNGFYNPLWQHYNWLNRDNRGWGENARSGRNGNGRGVNGVNGRGIGTRGSTITPRAVGSAAGIAGNAAQGAARAAVTGRSAQVVRPASQVLTSQGIRSSSGGMYSTGGAAIAGGNTSLGQTYSGGMQHGGAAMTRQGNYSGGYSNSFYRGAGSEPSIRGSGGFGGGYSSPSFRGGGGGGRSGGGGGGRSGGGHR